MFITILDYISVIPLFFISSTIHKIILYQDKNEFLFLLWLLTTGLSVEILKKINYPESLYEITRRPAGTYNTDFLSRNGIQNKNSAGFPSGHMAITSLYCFNKISKLKKSKKMFYIKYYYLSIIFLMGISRYYKKCHNLTQIIFGTIFGYYSNNLLLLYN